MPIIACNQCAKIVHEIRKTEDIPKQNGLLAELGKIIEKDHEDKFDNMCRVHMMNINYHKKEYNRNVEQYYKSKDPIDQQHMEGSYSQIRNQHIMLAQCYISHNEFPGISNEEKISWLNQIKSWWQRIRS